MIQARGARTVGGPPPFNPGKLGLLARWVLRGTHSGSNRGKHCRISHGSHRRFDRGIHRTVRRRFSPVTRRRDLLPGSLQSTAPHPAVHHTPGPLCPGVLGCRSLANPQSPHLPRIACCMGGPPTFPCRFRAAELAPLHRLEIPGSGKHGPHARAWVMRRFRPPMAAEDFLLQGTRQSVFDSTR